MYSIFLVEDEILIRESIKQLVAWEEYGFHFMGEAPDGEIAWPLIQKGKPDIVITDIKMPFMDGLLLSRLIKKELPQTIVIILSGHDDFSYAREAIGIGVNQYLLKPLSKDQLIEVLFEVKKKKDDEMAQEQYGVQFAREVQEYLFSSRRSLFEAMIADGLSLSALLERAKKLGLDLVAQRYNMVLFLLEEDIYHDYSTLVAQIQEDIVHYFSTQQHIILFSAGMGVTAFFIKAGQQQIQTDTIACMDALNQLCQPLQGKFEYVVAKGSPVARLSAIPVCYKAARKALFYRDDAKKLHGDNSIVAVDFDPNEMDASKLNAGIIEKFLMNGEEGDVADFVQNYFDGFGTNAMQSVMFRNYVVLHIQFVVNAFISRLAPAVQQENKEKKTDLLSHALSSEKGLRQYIMQVLLNAINLRDRAALSRHQEMLHRVVEYLKEHFCDPETNLNTTSKIGNMTPTYFSTIFSRQMGKTFVEYLTQLRMQKAQELLRCTSMSSSDIAYQVGYKDPHYFSYLFKKINGCSPRGYRNKTGGLPE